MTDAPHDGTAPEEQTAPPGAGPEASADGPLDDAALSSEEKADQPPAEEAGQTGQTGQTEQTDAERKVEELTADLQRLQAEYVNYKRRVDRDRELVAQNATYKVLAPITEVLDTIDRAREHGPLEDGFKVVADQLERIVASLGLTKFGAPGEPFDPTLHEALSHLGTDADVEVTTIKVLAKSGYRIGDRVVRAAQVLVVDPE